MKNVLITLALVATAALMTACSDDTILSEEYTTPAQQNVEAKDASTRSDADDVDSARVRINMYEMVDGYNVEISNVKIQNMAGSHAVPTFGNNFEGAVLSHDAYAPTYDTADGTFALVEEGTELRLEMTFDAKLTMENGEGVVRVKGAKVAINEGDINITASKVYDFSVMLDAKVLNLDSIEFTADVENWQ